MGLGIKHIIKLGPLSPTDICGGKQNYLSFLLCLTLSYQFPHTTPMASLSFNTTRIRTPTLQSHKPIPKFTSLTKPIKVSFTFLTKPSRRNQQKLHPIRSSSVSESSVFAPKEVEFDDDDQEEDDPTAELSYLDPETDPGSILEWELDFCSRPILDIRGKKLWELVVCDSSLSLQYTKYFPNNVINSVTLKDAIVSISDDLGVPLPEKIRFFR